MVVKTETAVDVASKIVKVVVYKNRAQLFRATDVCLSPGDYSLRFTASWQRADRNSLQVAVSRDTAANVLLRAVQFRSETITTDVRTNVAAVDESIKQLERRERDLDDAVAQANAGLYMLDRVRAKALRGGKVTNAATYDLAKWEAMVTFVEQRSTVFTTMKRERERERDGVHRELDDARNRRRLMAGNLVVATKRDFAEALVTVVGEPGGAARPLNLVLSYMVEDASWTPVYDIRVSRTARKLSVTYNAMVKQAMGESWDDIELELSTARAHTGGDPPALSTRYLSVYVAPRFSREAVCDLMNDNIDQILCRSVRLESLHVQKNMMRQMMPAAAPTPSSAPPLPRRTAPTITAAAVSAAGGTSVSFRIAALTSVASDGEPVRATISQTEFPAHFRFSATPKIDPHVYLKVKAINTSVFTFVAGKANVFSDQQFVCNSALPEDVAPNEEFWTFLGVDEDVTVSRTTLATKRTVTSSILSGTRLRLDHSFRFKVRSAKSLAEEVVIWDQLPILEDKRITLTLTSPVQGDGAPPSQPKFAINDLQFIEWFVTAKPGIETSFDFSYSLEHAADEQVAFR